MVASDRHSSRPKPRRVLFLQDHVATGGAAIAAARYAEYLKDLGLEVLVASGDREAGPGCFSLSGKPPRGPWRFLEALFPGQARRRWRQNRVMDQWRRLLQTSQPDLIWSHNLHGGWKWGWHGGLLDAALVHGPLVWTLHDMWALGDGPPYFEEEKVSAKYPTSFLCRLLQKPQANSRLRLTAPSEWLCRLVRQATSVACQKWECVLDPRQIHPEGREKSRASLGLQSSDLLVMAVAENLGDPRKGFALVQEAWSRCRGMPWFAHVHLGLVGRGVPQGLDRDPRIHHLGQISKFSRLASWFAAADLYLHPAEQDNFPLTVQEAQACGTPAVVFNRGGLAETIEHGRTGWILAERSVNSLVGKLKELAMNPAPLTSMRSQARERILEKQNSKTWSRNWDEVLRSFPPEIFPELR